LTAVAMKKRYSGSLKKSSKAKYTDAFRISFKINENVLTAKGDKVAYFIIKDIEGVVIASKGKFAIGEKNVYYSDTTTIDYQNKNTEVIVLTDVNREENIIGVYTITAVLAGKIVGETTVMLK
jgi:hypothetical protein